VSGDRAVEVIEEILTTATDPVLQEKAIFALSQHPSERSTRILRDLALDDQFSLGAREKAVFWLGERKSDKNYEFLKDLYPRVEETPLREKIIFSISRLKGKEAGEWLFEIALDESESVELRKHALFWAGQKTRLPMDRLDSLYNSLEDREMKKQLIFVLSQRKEKEALDKLFEIARTEDDVEIRKQAIFWLSQAKDERVIEFLEEILSE
jgi:HEAT repeat protein